MKIPVGKLFIDEKDKVLSVKFEDWLTNEELISSEMSKHIIDLGQQLELQLKKGDVAQDENFKE